MTPYGDIDPRQHWFRQWLDAWRHQAIAWTNVDLSSVKSGVIHLRASSPEIPQPPITKHDDVIKWKHFPRYWPYVWGIHRSPVNSPHIGQWRGALMFTLICARINGWVNNREAGDLMRHHANYGVIVMISLKIAYLNFHWNIKGVNELMHQFIIYHWAAKRSV